MARGEFERRRAALLALVGAGNIAIIAGAEQALRNRDVHYPFRQDSDFYYLTGFNEADALAVFIPGREQGEYVLFCREFDPQKALWEGAHAGLEGAKLDFGADQAFPIAEVDKVLPDLLQNKRKVFYPLGRDSELDIKLLEWIHRVRKLSRSGVSAPTDLASLEHILHEMRLRKSDAELGLMRRAAAVSAAAHARAMRACRPGMFEYQIEAELVHEFASQGLRAVAYPSIVAGGANACVLHYVENSAQLRDGDLLLIDAGVECDHYAADITRTFPVSGRFSQAQKRMYEWVLAAQAAALAEIRPGAAWNLAHDASVRVLTEGLLDLGLLDGEAADLIRDEKYKRFYMHRVGHWLGMDVHDVGEYKIDGEWRLLEPGMVLTVEPGLYVPADCVEAALDLRGVGIRIEDDVLVTESGYEVLTAAAPKSVAEIEALMQAGD